MRESIQTLEDMKSENEEVMKQLYIIEPESKFIEKFAKQNQAIDKAINGLRWIPVDEKLPDKDGDYLVQLQIDARGKEIYFMQVSFTRFDDGDTEWLYNSFYNAFKNVDPFVIAWRPLPKPYENK